MTAGGGTLTPTPTPTKGALEVRLKFLEEEVRSLTCVLALDLTAIPFPDIAEGLKHGGFLKWTNLLILDPKDVASLSKNAGGSTRVPLM